MAEKKIGDLAYLIIFSLFFLGMFSALIIAFDAQYINSNSLGGDLETLYNSSGTSYQATDKSTYQDTFNTSAFSIPTGSDVDVRGTSQVAILGKNSPSTIESFVTGAAQYLKLHGYILLFISLLIIVTGVILFLRFLRPGGA